MKYNCKKIVWICKNKNSIIYIILGSKAPKAVRACTIRFLSLGPAKT